MRAREILSEYDRSREQQRIEQLPAYAQRLKQDPGFSLEKLESADPTAQKIYVPRLTQWWLRGEPTEDLISTVADALEKYHNLKTKRLLKPEHADINRFSTADSFLAAVGTYQIPGQKPEQDRGNYTQIHRDDQLIVVQLLDKTAAKWWGQNTQWCTAARNNNQFDHYHKKGPLYVIIDRVANTRYQLWWNKTNAYDMQFMDVNDESVKPAQLKIFSRLQPIFNKLHSHIMWISNPSEAVQLMAVRKDGGAIRYIPNPSEAVQLAAVQQNGRAIRCIPNPSEAVQLMAVQQTGWAIRHIPNPSEAVQLAAVQQAPWAIAHISNPSEAVQLAAVRKDGGAIEWIPNPSEAVQLMAVRRYSSAIMYIQNPTEAVQLAAVRKNPRVIDQIRNPTPAVQALAKKLQSTK